MKMFKFIFRAIFGLVIGILLLFIFCNILFNGVFPFAGYILTDAILFLQIPILLIFFIVVIYSWLFNKVQFSFFKIEFYYILICVITMVLMGMSQALCPTCKF